jgi:hypothetical protein
MKCISKQKPPNPMTEPKEIEVIDDVEYEDKTPQG